MENKENQFSEAVILSLVSYINDLSPNSITIDELQKISGYSKRHLTRLFTKHTGVRPAEYIKLLQMYRLLLELKFTTSTHSELCKKYKIKDIANFKINFAKTTGCDLSEVKTNTSINFSHALRKINIKKEYLSCSFVSLFDFNFKPKGKEYTFERPINKIMSSHFDLVENTVNEFCAKYDFNRCEIWTCARFSPIDNENYKITLIPCVNSNVIEFQEGVAFSLQGDYLRFTWVGVVQDTFPKIKKIYDLFFIKYGAVRKNGYDIINRKKMDGVRGYYVFTYHIPVVINESILSALND